jgi:hypothetical protein
MLRRDFLKGSAALVGGLSLGEISLATPTGQNTKIAKGKVHIQGRDQGIPGVLVSNGISVVKTDRDGRYQISVDDDTTLFVVKPPRYKAPVDANNLPQFFHHHKPNGSPATKYEGVKPTGALPNEINFPLIPTHEPNDFRMILFGDPQPRNQEEIDYMSHDVIEQIAKDEEAMDALFGLSLGDIMFDNLQFYEPLNQSIATIGKSWFSLVGNHDLNLDAPNDALSTETFKRTFGPNYYAFNYGPVHFVVLDNVMYHGKEVGGYHGELSYAQLVWLKNHLVHVPKDQLLVIAMHIPIWDTNNRAELYRLIEDRPHTVSFSAHTHYQRHVFIGKEDGWQGNTEHHHLNHATVCGCWWGGAPDERGIPHATMSDGAPNGYSLVEFSGTNYKIKFRPASRPVNEQMSIFVPEEIAQADSGNTEFVVNVFAGSTQSTVEAKINGGEWKSIPNVPGPDPYIARLKELEGKDPKPPGRGVAGPTTSNHIWKAKLPDSLKTGLNLIEVRTTDMFGQTHTGRRTFRVK